MDSYRLNPVEKSDNSANVDPPLPHTLQKSDYSLSLQPKHHQIFKIIAIIILLIVLASALAIGINHFDKKSKAAKTNVVNTLPLTSQIGLPAANQQYYSTNLSLGFNYPKTWTINDNAITNILTIQSPAIELLASNSKLEKGRITLTIQNLTPVIPGFQNGNATAALESQLITYTNPTATQRASTYISFLHYASSPNPASNIDAIYVTGNAGYKLNQYIPESAIIAVSPAIGITFSSCTNTACTGNGSPMSISSTAWNTTSFSAPILTLLKSLSIT